MPLSIVEKLLIALVFAAAIAVQAFLVILWGFGTAVLILLGPIFIFGLIALLIDNLRGRN